ncbi:MAG: TIGR03619 family F420-dependent LLM class oxidoreductase [Proteobacteria bacterium]|nr:TIGR03619 family F420-dependent LLM class oxidoreductase [Pseudomonadota bacterium]
MRFGVNILSRGPMASREGYKTVAAAAERLGFSFLSANDHVVVPADIDSRYPYSEEGDWAGGKTGECLDVLSALTFLAGATDKLKLLTSVMVVPHRPAIQTAKMIATADILSGGRMIVGVGAGWMREEIEALAVAPYDERGKVTDEFVAAFRELWTKPRPEMAGKYVSFSNILFEPKPVSKPHPPIWVGGESEAAMRRAIRLGDGWYPASSNPANRLDTAERAAAAMAAFKAKCEAAKRDPSSIALAHVVLWPVNWTAEAAASGGRRTFTGTSAEMVEDAGRLKAAGVGDVNVSFPAPTVAETVAKMERFAKEVMAKV